MNVVSYLKTCQVRGIAESETASVPPSPEELRSLLGWLTTQKLSPIIIGSVGVVHHIKPDGETFRPTHDVDVFVQREPGQPPSGWRVDPASPGMTSWISPSGGYVDFAVAGHEFPGGEAVPQKVQLDPRSPTHFPVAQRIDLLKMKLNSYRDKDLHDAIALLRSMDQLPTRKDLGKLNQQQADNWNLVTQWIMARPKGKYGE